MKVGTSTDKVPLGVHNTCCFHYSGIHKLDRFVSWRCVLDRAVDGCSSEEEPSIKSGAEDVNHIEKEFQDPPRLVTFAAGSYYYPGKKLCLLYKRVVECGFFIHLCNGKMNA